MDRHSICCISGWRAIEWADLSHSLRRALYIILFIIVCSSTLGSLRCTFQEAFAKHSNILAPAGPTGTS